MKFSSNTITMLKQAIIIIHTILLVLTFCISSAKSQNNELSREQLQDFTRISGTIFTKSGTNTIGSPYLNDDFFSGFVMLSERTRSEELNLRFNIEKNEVEYLKGGEIYVLNGSEIRGFTILAEDANITFKNGFNTTIKGVDSGTFLRTVYEGNVKFVVNYSANLQEDIASYSSATKTNKYRVFKKYYLINSEGKFREIKSPREDFLDLFSENRELLESFIKNENLNLDYEKDIVALIKYNDKLE